MLLTLTSETQEFASRAIQNIIDKYYREYQPETTRGYESLLDILNHGTTTLHLTTNQFHQLFFATLNSDKTNIHWHRIMNELNDKEPINTNALTTEELIAKHGKPVFIKNINAWAIVHVETQSRNEPGLPYVKGIDFDYNIIMRGLQCLTYEPE